MNRTTISSSPVQKLSELPVILHTKNSVINDTLKDKYFELINDDNDLKMGNNAKSYLDENKSKILDLIDKNLESESMFSSISMKHISTFRTTSTPPKPGSRFKEPIILYDEFFSKLKTFKPFMYKTKNNQVIHCKDTVNNIDSLIQDIVKDVDRTTFYYEQNFYKFNFVQINNKSLDEMHNNMKTYFSKTILTNFYIFLNYIFPSYKCNLCFKNNVLQSLRCNNCSKLSSDECTNINTLFSEIHNNKNNKSKKIQDECVNDLKNILYNYLLFYQLYDTELMGMLNDYENKHNLQYNIGSLSNKYTFFDTHNNKKIKYTIYYIFYKLPTDSSKIIDLGYIVNVAYLDEPTSDSFNYIDLSRAPKDFFNQKQTVKKGGSLKKSKFKLHKNANKSTVNKYKFKRFTKRKTYK